MRYLSLWVVLLFFVGCREAGTPKPYGYFRISFPQKEYKKIDNGFPFVFEIPKYAVLERDTNKRAEKYWCNVQFPQFKSTIHISYKKIENNLDQIIEDSHAMAYKHSVKADAIKPTGLVVPEKRLFGLMYEIKGDAASSYQFVLTDSVKHFVRGALYINVRPNKDSLAPVVQFLKKDIEHIMNSFEWKEVK